MRVLVANVQAPFVRGGAEMHAESLVAALRAHGHQAEVTTFPFKWYPAANIPNAMLLARLLEVDAWLDGPIDRLIALKFPATLMRHPAKVLWLLHQYRGAYDFWGTEAGDLDGAPDGRAVRDAIRAADDALLGEARAIYTNSRVVSDRLLRFNGIPSTPLHHPPPGAALYETGQAGDYLLCPGRVNPTKRQHLAIEALARMRTRMTLVLIGPEDSPDYARSIRARTEALGVDDRVEWRGVVSDADKRALYADARAVVVPPLDEDYGYVTLEAMLAGKPVVTCRDSGFPLDFVRDGETARVAAPDPASLADALDAYAGDAARAERDGRAARAHYDTLGLDWTHVVERLLS